MNIEEKKPTNFAELGLHLEQRIESVKKCYNELIQPYQTEYGINVSLMTKKEKEEFINKRNCLLLQEHCYNEILDLITLIK